MKHKKKMELSNKLFLIGLGLISAVAVGTTAATKSYISSLSSFDNFYDLKGYHVYAENMVDVNEAASAVTGTAINADTIIRNTGDIPVLVRISYFNLPASEVFTNDADCGPVDRKALINKVEENKGLNLGEVELKDGSGNGTGIIAGKLTDGSTKAEWSLELANSNKFSYYGDDGCYYYKGILGSNQSIQHLDSVTLLSESAGFSAVEKTYYQTDTYSDDGWVEGTTPDGQTETGRKSAAILVSANPLKLNLVVLVETIQATDANFNTIEKLPENPTASTMQGYWNVLLPSQSTT